MFTQSKVTVKDGVKVVIKEFSDLPSVKWIVSIPFIPIYPYTLSSRERLAREYKFMLAKHSKVKTPKVYRVDFEVKVLEREYVEGKLLSDVNVELAAEVLGEALSSLHVEGWVLGDPKPSNFLLSSRGNVYVLDAEQALESFKELYMSWDVLMTLLFLGIYNPLEAAVKSFRLFKVFSKSYRRGGGSLKIIDKALEVLETVKKE